VTTALDVTLACDIMMDLEGSIRPAMYLASELVARGYGVSMISPAMSDDVEERLRVSGIMPINLRAKLAAKNSGLSLLWFETWAREAFLKLNSRRIDNESSVMINFSQVVSVPSWAWYLQGPPSIALKDMEKELSTGFRIAYNVLKTVIEYADKRLVSRIGGVSALVIANSKFCASMYSKLGINVYDIIYPPIDCQTFRLSTSNPSSNYVLTYFGKETKFSVVKRIADMGVKIRAFGSKTPFIRRDLIEHSNIEFLGRVTTSELVDQYSNALFTLFPFTHEPFGYVPLESMACGTPVLTSNMQGPSEYVIHDGTGWLVDTDEEFVYKALELWKGGYPSRIRLNCVKAASKFDKKFYFEKWLQLLEDFCESKFSGSVMFKNKKPK
jgi:glycosyltransferase involved in cell wall biosynthesis